MGMRTVWIRTDESVKRAADLNLDHIHHQTDDLATWLRRLGGPEVSQDVKILILGAGAVGGYFGARLHQAGADVTFLLRERAPQDQQGKAWSSKVPRATRVLPVKVVTKGGERRALRHSSILACKAYDLDSGDGVDRAGGRARHHHRAAC